MSDKPTYEELLEMVRSVDDVGQHFETRQHRKDGTLIEVELSNYQQTFRSRYQSQRMPRM